MSCLQQPLVQPSRLSSSSALSTTNVPAAAILRPARRAQRTVPQAFMGGYCGSPFAASRVNQQILQQMFQQASDMARSPTETSSDFELPLAVDAADEGDMYVFRADIPGVQRADLKVCFLSPGCPLWVRLSFLVPVCLVVFLVPVCLVVSRAYVSN